MGSLWGPWVPLVTILGSLWDLVGVPWGSNGGFGGTLVCFVPPLGLCWSALGLKWQLWQDDTDEKKLPKLYI